MKCPKCQHQNITYAKFCSKCGCRLESEVSSSITQSQTCSKCGAVIQSGEKFCAKCGTPIAPKGVEPEEKTMILYASESDDADDHTVIMNTENVSGTLVTPVTPVVPTQDNIEPPANIDEEDRKVKVDSKVRLIIVAVMLGVLAIAGIVIALVFFLPHNIDMKKASGKSDAVKIQPQENTGANSMQELLENRQYTELIDTLLAIDDQEFYGDADNMREYLRQALVGHMNTAVNEAQELASSGDFDGAFGKIDAEIAYRNNLKGQGRVYPFTDESTELETEKEQLTKRYIDYIYENTQSKAEQRDLQGMESLLGQASGKLPESEYNRISIEAYYLYVIKMVDQMQASGKNPYEIMNFIDSYFEQTNYHGYIMELWDNQNAQSGRVNTWNATVNHIDANGFLLYNSNTRYIDKSELASFSQYELYLARWEMYARHDRIFVDNALNTHFSKYSWYNGSADFTTFNDNSLNEYEKGNIKTIIEFEKECGYR